MTYDPFELLSARECRHLEEMADRESGIKRQELLLRAALKAVDAARETPEHLPKWRVRHWLDAMELAWLAGLPWVAARIAREHLTGVELSAKVVRDRVAEVLAAERAPTVPPAPPSERKAPRLTPPEKRTPCKTMSTHDVERYLCRAGLLESPSQKAAA
jgi:hypothetical protein